METVIATLSEKFFDNLYTVLVKDDVFKVMNRPGFMEHSAVLAGEHINAKFNVTWCDPVYLVELQWLYATLEAMNREALNNGKSVADKSSSIEPQSDTENR